MKNLASKMLTGIIRKMLFKSVGEPDGVHDENNCSPHVIVVKCETNLSWLTIKCALQLYTKPPLEEVSVNSGLMRIIRSSKPIKTFNGVTHIIIPTRIEGVEG